jgi:hypothetical protein
MCALTEYPYRYGFSALISDETLIAASFAWNMPLLADANRCLFVYA